MAISPVPEVVIGIGGAAGDGVASSGRTLALALARQGLAHFAYNSYQSVIRGGHSWLRIRVCEQQPRSHGDAVDLLIALNQDTLDRHLQEVKPGGIAIYNADKFKPSGSPPHGVQMIGLPLPDLTEAYRGLPVMQNTVAVGAAIAVMGLRLEALESVIAQIFKKKGEEVIATNVNAARAGHAYALEHFRPLARPLRPTDRRYAVLSGNEALAMGGAAAGVKFYVAYPMSPSTGILHWMARHAERLGIVVRQVEDEIAVINMAIGANFAGVRAMCATSGGGFALMTEAIGMAGMIETPVVVINVQRAGPSTGVPTKTEQGDLNQALGASQGDFPRIVIAPSDVVDAFRTVPEAFNLADRFQCPVIILSDLYLSEGSFTVPPEALLEQFEIDRGDLIAEANGDLDPLAAFPRFANTETGISPRPVPGVPGHPFVAATDEHDEDGVLVSDVYTDPVIRKKMVDKRARKMLGVLDRLPAPRLEGPAEAEVTLVGWGSTRGVIAEAAERLCDEGLRVNRLHIKYLLPLHGEVVLAALCRGQRVIIVENNSTGQLAHHLRAETGFAAHGHIRKYDGEPFEPKHIVAGVKAVLGGDEIVEVLSEEPGWRTPHPEVAGRFAARVN